MGNTLYRKRDIKKLNLKAVTIIYHVTDWFEVKQYNNKREISIANLVETTWLSRYPRPMEITYDQGKELIGHEFIKYMVET